MPSIALEFGGLSNSLDETKVPHGNCWSMQNCTTLRGVLEGSARYLIFGSRSGAAAGDVGYGFGHGKMSANEVQRLALSFSTAPTSGDIDLVFDGQQTTTALNYNATATEVLTSLEALSNIDIGDVKVTGGPWPSTPFDVEYTGQYANSDVALMTSAANTLNNSATLTPALRRSGGLEEVYLAAVKHDGDSTVTMYKVDASTGVFTSIATGLTASDWFFEQYGDRIFAINATDGLNYYRLGGSWNDGSATAKPKAPAIRINFLPTDYNFNPSVVGFNSGWASITQSGLGGAPTVTGGNTTIQLLSDTALTSATEITVTATYTAAQSQMFNDIFRVAVFSEAVADVAFLTGSLKFVLINADGTPLTIEPVATMLRYGDGGTYLTGYFHFANSLRTSRDNILKYQIQFTVSSWGAAKKAFIQVHRGLAWMASYVPFDFESGESDIGPVPERRKIAYAYSYYNATTQVESDLSEVGRTEALPTNWAGCSIACQCRGSSELTTSDRIFVYRQEALTGQWRRLPVDPNNLGTYGVANATSGNVTYTDKWMEEELQDFPTRQQSDFGGTRQSSAGSAIGRWKQSLVVGVNRKAWLSFVGFLGSESPVFASDPDDKAGTIQFNLENAENPDRGRTVYMSDNRAEEVYAIIGQDSLYLAGPDSCYTMVGDSPSESSPPRRLPGSRGAVGKRSAHPYKGGFHAAAADGLYYYAVGRGFSGEDNGALTSAEETEPVRRSYKTTLLGSSYSGLVICEHEDEVWLFNGTKFLVNNRNKRWEEGTFADSVLAAISIRTRGLFFMDSKGRIHKISADYTDDNGTAATWEYQTGLLEGPRVRMTDLEVQRVGTPRITVHVYHPQGNLSDTYGKYSVHHFDDQARSIYRLPVVLEGSTRHRFIISGTVGRDKVTNAVLHYEGTGKPYNG